MNHRFSYPSQPVYSSEDPIFRRGCGSAWWSLAMLVVLAGCGGSGQGRSFSDEDDVDNVDPIASHDHSQGPHDGQVTVFGNEDYHGELVYNGESQELTVYLLGADMKSAYPIEQPSVRVVLDLDGEQVEYTLPAQPIEGEAAGTSSRFTLAVEHAALKPGQAVSGQIIATFGDREYTGRLSAEDGHAHDHGHSHDHDHSDHSHESHDHGHSN